MAFSLMLFLMDMHIEQGSLQSIVNLVLTVGAVVFGQLAFKKANEGFISLGQGFKIGLGICVLGSVIGTVYGILQMTILDPDTMTKVMEYSIDQAIEQNPELTDEVIDAIDQKNVGALQEELGDVLLQLIFHAQINEEEGHFTFLDVISTLREKLIRRHPHVFSSAEVESADQVIEQWDEIKRLEKEQKSELSILSGIPRQLPALLRATQVQKRVARIGFDWESMEGVLMKIEEELQEVRKALKENDHEAVREEFGDLLFSVVNATRYMGFQAEEILSDNVEKFVRRFERLEEMVLAEGKRLDELTTTEMDVWWNQVKLEEN